jgi:hypothetical protein
MGPVGKAVAVACATLGVAVGCGHDVDSPASAPRALFAARNSVSHAAADALGAYYACTIAVSQKGGKLARIDLYVTTSEVRQEAEGILREFGRKFDSRVSIVESRFSQPAMRDVFQGVIEAIPSGRAERSSSQVGHEPSTNLSRCPRVTIAIEKPGVASPAMEAWARQAVGRYGSDRIKVSRDAPAFEFETGG